MSNTPRHALPLLAAGQVGKEFLHNEALQALDALVGAAVEEGPRVVPPTSPAVGACYIIADGATDDWSGRDGCLASYTVGGWRILTPAEGQSVFVRSSSVQAVFRGGNWEIGQLRTNSVVVGGDQVVGGRGAAIAAPSGGSTVDTQARTAIASILSALRQHGLIAT